MDGYGTPYPGQPGPPANVYSGQPVQGTDYNQQPIPRPPSQSNTQASHSGTFLDLLFIINYHAFILCNINYHDKFVNSA